MRKRSDIYSLHSLSLSLSSTPSPHPSLSFSADEVGAQSTGCVSARETLICIPVPAAAINPTICMSDREYEQHRPSRGADVESERRAIFRRIINPVREKLRGRYARGIGVSRGEINVQLVRRPRGSPRRRGNCTRERSGEEEEEEGLHFLATHRVDPD